MCSISSIRDSAIRAIFNSFINYVFFLTRMFLFQAAKQGTQAAREAMVRRIRWRDRAARNWSNHKYYFCPSIHQWWWCFLKAPVRKNNLHCDVLTFQLVTTVLRKLNLIKSYQSVINMEQYNDKKFWSFESVTNLQFWRKTRIEN